MLSVKSTTFGGRTFHPRFLIPALLSVFLACMANPSSAGGRFGREITLKLEDESISAAIVALSKTAGISIELVGLSGDAPISVNLRNATMQKSIARILAGFNFTIIWSHDMTITVLVLDQDSDPVTTNSASRLANEPLSPPEENKTNLPRLVGNRSAADDELVPPSPDDPFASTVTLQDLREQDRNRVRLPPELDELLPPSAPGELGLTVAEFEAMVKAQPPRSQNKELGITDLVPPN